MFLQAEAHITSHSKIPTNLATLRISNVQNNVTFSTTETWSLLRNYFYVRNCLSIESLGKGTRRSTEKSLEFIILSPSTLFLPKLECPMTLT